MTDAHPQPTAKLWRLRRAAERMLRSYPTEDEALAADANWKAETTPREILDLVTALDERGTQDVRLEDGTAMPPRSSSTFTVRVPLKDAKTQQIICDLSLEATPEELPALVSVLIKAGSTRLEIKPKLRWTIHMNYTLEEKD